MPTITVNLNELRRLMGKEIADSRFKEILPLNKIEIEEWGQEIKLEITTDRPDLFSVEGIARQLRGWLDIERGLKSYFAGKPKIKLRTDKVMLRPYISCAVVRDLEINNMFVKSIMQLSELLDLTLGRDRRKIAIGLHDMRELTPPFHYTEISPKGIKFIPLDFEKKITPYQIIRKHPKGRMYSHLVFKSPKYPIILDSKNNVLSFPPIINGELTKLNESTEDVFIEITGTDMLSINNALNILVTALAERGGKIEKVNVDSKTTPELGSNTIILETNNVKRLLGIDLKSEEIKLLLERMNYGVIELENKSEVVIPPYRFDILHQVDIIEDIAIAYSYNDFIPEIPKIPFVGKLDKLEEFANTIRGLMVGLGFQEILNYTLTSKEKNFKLMNTSETPVVELKNPISKDYSICKTWLLPKLLENLSMNKHRRFPQRIFEISDCVVVSEDAETKTMNVKKLCGVISHSKTNLTEIVSIINAIKQNLSLDFRLKNTEHNSFIDGRSGKIIKNKTGTGFFGEVHPKILDNWGLEKPVTAFEMDLEKMYQ